MRNAPGGARRCVEGCVQLTLHSTPPVVAVDIGIERLDKVLSQLTSKFSEAVAALKLEQQQVEKERERLAAQEAAEES